MSGPKNGVSKNGRKWGQERIFTISFFSLRIARSSCSIPLKLRADFDWAGLRILDRFYDPSSPRLSLWRMTAADYRSCHATQALTGTPHRPTWAGELTEAMKSNDLAAYEEELIDVLIADLDRGPETRPQ